MPHGSGGTERIAKIAQEFKNLNFKCEFLGTVGLKRFFEIREIDINVQAIPLPFFLLHEKSKFHRLLAYCWTSLKVSNFTRGIRPDFVYSASDYFPDIITSVLLRRKSSFCRWIAIIHHKTKFNRDNFFTILSSSFAIVLQNFSWFLISKRADLILLYDSNEGLEISHSNFFEGKSVGFVRNGIDFSVIKRAKPYDFAPDILLCGGPRQSKGVMDLPPLLKYIKNRFPDVTVGVAGHGTDKVIAALKRELKAIGMESNVTFFGNLPKMELYGLMKSAGMIISLSYEEGWGIAMREALACGRPCVAYKLAAFDNLERHLKFVKLGDIEAMSTEVTNLLASTAAKQSNLNLSAGESWSEVAAKELSLIRLKFSLK